MSQYQQHLHELNKAKAETEPDKLQGLSVQEMQWYRKRFFALESCFLDGRLVAECRDRIEILDREIQLKRIEEKADKRHQESHGVGKKTLWWARIAAWAGIAAIPVTIASLIYQTYSSKVPPATSAPASPLTSLQSRPPINESQEPEASSNSATPSPQQAATAQPSVNPPES